MPMLAVTKSSCPFDVERLRERVEDLPRHAGHRLRADDLGEQDAELVAADARDRVGRAQRGLQPPRDVGEQAIAERVPEAVVHELEVIEVEVHHREADAVAPRVREAVHEAVAEEQAVRQAGQRVVVRAVLELLLGLLALRDVAVVEDDRAARSARAAGSG